jgi:transcriptional regulator with XRE-family HTH domain
MDDLAPPLDPDSVRRHEIAARVQYWMRRRGMSRQVFADRMGKSVSWVDKIKSGDRQLERLSVLRRVARALDVPLPVLIDDEASEQAAQCIDAVEVAALAAALQSYDGILTGGQAAELPSLSRLARGVEYGWSSFETTNYTAVGAMLPDQLTSLQRSVRMLSGPERDRATTLLIQSYQLAAEAAFKVGRADLGWVAADRGIILAEQLGDLALIGGTARRVAHALMATGSGSRAIDLIQTTASRLHSELRDASSACLSAYGMLFLKGTIAAARDGHVALVRDFLAEAQDVATQLGPNPNVQWSNFGTANVAVHRVSALADLHEGGRVVEEAARIDPGELGTLSKERRANHLLDVSRGYSQWGKRDKAIATLLDADQLAPEDVRCRPVTKRLIAALAQSFPRGIRPSAAFNRLANAVGLPT